MSGRERYSEKVGGPPDPFIVKGFLSKVSLKDGKRFDGRSQSLIKGWLVGDARFMVTAGAFSPKKPDNKNWVGDALLLWPFDAGAVPGGETRVGVKFADPAKGRMGQVKTQSKNGKVQGSLRGLHSTTESQAQTPGWNPGMIDAYETDEKFTAPAAVTRVKTEWEMID